VITTTRGDITQARADAIVCSAGGALETAIRRAAGPRLAEALAHITRPGVTHAGDLDARFVIHTVAPTTGDEALTACYRAVLAQAAALDCTSVAVPAIGTGAGYTLFAAANAATAAAAASPVPHIQFWLSTDQAAEAFDQALLSHTPPLRAARKADWKTEPWPALTPLDFEQTVDGDRLLLGNVPREMEDKWFVYRDGDQLLIHRSWTGILMFRVAFERLPHDRLRLHNALYNANPEHFKGDAESAATHLAGVIRRVAG
jgi:O-acetyl-ADP-ribose deacetylase (regulator of RNase III)